MRIHPVSASGCPKLCIAVGRGRPEWHGRHVPILARRTTTCDVRQKLRPGHGRTGGEGRRLRLLGQQHLGTANHWPSKDLERDLLERR